MTDVQGASRSNELLWVAQQLPHYTWACNEIERVNREVCDVVFKDQPRKGNWWPFLKTEHGFYDLDRPTDGSTRPKPLERPV